MRGRSLIAISARGLRGGVENLSLDIVRGEITVICGGPGSGKTALLRLLAGLDRPRAGTVRIEDQNGVFLDEPEAVRTAGQLDSLHRSLRTLTAGRGGTAVIATSHPQVAAWADRLVALDRGALVLDIDAPTPAEAGATVRALGASPL